MAIGLRLHVCRLMDTPSFRFHSTNINRRDLFDHLKWTSRTISTDRDPLAGSDATRPSAPSPCQVQVLRQRSEGSRTAEITEALRTASPTAMQFVKRAAQKWGVDETGGRRRLLVRAALLCFCVSASAQQNPDILFADGFENCSTYLDADQDRLIDCQEVLGNTSDPANPDTDGDGLRDGDEVLGTLGGLNLPALGVKPKHKDVLLEIDWVVDSWQCAEGAHDHMPVQSSIDQAKQMFASAPVQNPDRITGINLIIDAGQAGALTGGNAISTIPDGFLPFPFGTEYQAAKTANFASNRKGYFRYQLHAHRYGSATEGSSGWGEIVGDDSIVTLYCLRSPANVRNTIVHELGHNLGLDHGGNTPCNLKPNYNSIMSYIRQFDGVDTNCDGFGDGIDLIDYSTGVNRTLDENHLDESLGICPASEPAARAVDWDGSPTVFTDLSWNINKYGYEPSEIGQCGGTKTVLTDFNDWANLVFGTGLPTGSGGAEPLPIQTSCAAPPQ